MSGDKPILYPEAGLRSFDMQHYIRDLHKSMSRLAWTFTGSSAAFFTGCAASAEVSPSLTINIAEGWIYQLAALDATQWGGLDADLNLYLRQGYKDDHQVTFSNSGISGGQSRWALVQGRYVSSDAVRDDDPNAGVLYYWNADAPDEPFLGPENSSDEQPTVRLALLETAIKYGTSATTGSQTAPLPDSGWVPMYLVLIANGQTTITNGQILAAGPSVGTGVAGDYPAAPFNKGLYGHTHTGAGGDAPQIDLTTGITGILPFGNAPASNSSPPASSYFAVFGRGAGSPQGVRAGALGDRWFDTTGFVEYECTTAGIAAAAVWTPVAIPETIFSAATTVSPTGRIHKIYSLRPTANCTVSPGTAQSMLGSLIWIKNDLDLGSAYTVTFDPNGGELVDGKTTLVLYPGQVAVLYPRYMSSTGSWTLASGAIGQPFGGNGGRQLPTSGALSGYYQHSGDWTSTGAITFAAGTKIKIAGSMSLAHTMDGGYGVSGGLGVTNSGRLNPSNGNGPCPGIAYDTNQQGGGGGGNGGKGGHGGSRTANRWAAGGSAIGIDEYFGSSSGAGGSSAGTDDAGNGGKAGGSLYLEIAGNLTITGDINILGEAGGNGEATDGAGGGGGAGGSFEARVGGNFDCTAGGIDLSGGAGGDGGGTTGTSGGAGGGGGGGNARVVAGGTITGDSNIVVAGGVTGTGASSQAGEDGDDGEVKVHATTRLGSRF